MALVSHSITCLQKKTIAPDVVELWFTKPEGFTFKAGQFVLFDVPLVENPADIQPRAYSMASSPAEPDLGFVLKIIPNGRFSRYCNEVLGTGAVLTMKGPFGLFTLDPAPDAHLILAATGTGLAPFRSQIIDMTDKGDRRRVDLVFGVQKKEHLFWTRELEELTRTHANVQIHETLSEPDGEWIGLQGWVQKHIPSLISDPEKTLLYACGNPEMTKEVKKLALEEWRLPKKNLHVEGYI